MVMLPAAMAPPELCRGPRAPGAARGAAAPRPLPRPPTRSEARPRPRPPSLPPGGPRPRPRAPSLVPLGPALSAGPGARGAGRPGSGGLGLRVSAAATLGRAASLRRSARDPVAAAGTASTVWHGRAAASHLLHPHPRHPPPPRAAPRPPGAPPPARSGLAGPGARAAARKRARWAPGGPSAVRGGEVRGAPGAPPGWFPPEVAPARPRAAEPR